MGILSPPSRILSDWLEAKLAGSRGSKLMEEQRDGALRTLHLSDAIREIRHQVHVSIKVRTLRSAFCVVFVENIDGGTARSRCPEVR